MGLFGKKEGKGNKESEESSTNVTTNDGDEKGGLFKGLFSFGSQGKPSFPVDFSDGYAAKGYTLDFLHLPSNEEHSFKAFLTQFADNFTSQFSETSVYGRMDNIYTFKQTTRQMSVGFAIPAFSLENARENLANVGALARKLYPYYGGGAGDNVSSLSRAPLIRIRFANLIRSNQNPTLGLLGKVTGFTFTPNLDHGFFDLKNFLYPKTIDVSFTFDVLHETTMGWVDGTDAKGNPEEVFGFQESTQDPSDSSVDPSTIKYNSFPYAAGINQEVVTAAAFNPPDPPTETDAEADAAGILGGDGDGAATGPAE